MTISHDPFVNITERIAPGATLVRQWPLEGGVSVHVDALELAHLDGEVERLVVRRHWRVAHGADPDIALNEYRLLAALHAHGIAVPAPRFVDPRGELCGVPTLVMDFVEGATELAPALAGHAMEPMARFLAALHRLDLDTLDLAFLPRREDPIDHILHQLPQTPDTDRLHRALAGLPARPPRNPPALLHGDYWPNNILWQDGVIAAVIDWEDAAIGDPVADLAGCRVELLWKFDMATADAFTARYLAHNPIDVTDLPLWELFVASAGAAHMGKWGLPPDVEADMRRKSAWVVARVLDTLAGSAR